MEHWKIRCSNVPGHWNIGKSSVPMFRDSLHIHTQSQRGMFVRSAPALTCLPDLHTITAVMAPLPRDFTACEIETLQDDVGDATALPLIRTVKPRDTTVIGKTLLWSAWPINSIAPTQDVFDELWGWLGKGGKRYLSVRRGTDDDSLWALLFKGDQAELDLSKAPEGVTDSPLRSPKARPRTSCRKGDCKLCQDGLVQRLRRGHIELLCPTTSRFWKRVRRREANDGGGVLAAQSPNQAPRQRRARR